MPLVRFQVVFFLAVIKTKYSIEPCAIMVTTIGKKFFRMSNQTAAQATNASKAPVASKDDTNTAFIDKVPQSKDSKKRKEHPMMEREAHSVQAKRQAVDHRPVERAAPKSRSIDSPPGNAAEENKSSKPAHHRILERLKQDISIRVKNASVRTPEDYFAHCMTTAVEQWDEGVLVGVFESAHAAARLTNIAQAAISAVRRGDRFFAGGYVWKPARRQNLQWLALDFPIRMRKAEQRRTVKGTPVEQWDGNKLVGVFASAYVAAALTDAPKATISAVCRGERKSAGGYVWKIARPEHLHWLQRDFEIHKSKTAHLYLSTGKAKAVEQWDGDQLVGVFPSCYLAGQITDVSRKSIANAYRREGGTAGGYIWKRAKPENLHWLSKNFVIRKCRHRQNTQVEQWDGNVLVGVFPCAQVAGRLTGIPSTAISYACDRLGQDDLAGGYRWKFAEQHNLGMLHKGFIVHKRKDLTGRNNVSFVKKEANGTSVLWPKSKMEDQPGKRWHAKLPQSASIKLEEGHEIIVLSDDSDTDVDSMEAQKKRPWEEEQAQLHRPAVFVNSVAAWLKIDVFHPDAEDDETRDTAQQLVSAGFRSKEMILADPILPESIQKLHIIKLHKRAIAALWRKHQEK